VHASCILVTKQTGGDDMNSKIIAERLRTLRGDIPRETVCNAVGISTSALAMYENGERIPRDSIKIAIAKFYGKSVETIFFAR
jgi:putative transcriptional regulator